MFTSKANAEQQVKDAIKKGQIELNNAIQTFSEKYRVQQNELTENFNFNLVSEIKINVWDEISKYDQTYAYVEMNDFPAALSFDILNDLRLHLIQNGMNNVEIRFYDSTVVHPLSVLAEFGPLTSFKRWELLLSNVNDEDDIDEIVKVLNNAPLFKGKPLNAYSES